MAAGDVVTFVRRGRRDRQKTAADATTYERLPADDDAYDKENVPCEATPAKQEKAESASWVGRWLSYATNAVTPGGAGQSRRARKEKRTGYNRKVAPSLAARKKAEFSQYLRDMKNYFKDVDAYELVEASPAKVAPRAAHAIEASEEADRRRRASSIFGALSQQNNRRRSSIVIRRESVSDYSRRSLAPAIPGGADALAPLAEEGVHDPEGPVIDDTLNFGALDLNATLEPATPTKPGRMPSLLPEVIEEDEGDQSSDAEEHSAASPTPTLAPPLASAPAVPAAALDPKAQLLVACNQDGPDGVPTMAHFLERYFPGCLAGARAPSARASAIAPASGVGVSKIGEGTFGEAFRIGGGPGGAGVSCVVKIVPIDGSLLVNGEKQKTSEELFAEVIIHNRLAKLRNPTPHPHSDAQDKDGNEEGGGRGGGEVRGATNACCSFIETHAVAVCRGRYPKALVSAWEDWDDAHGSENDHVGAFPASQRYVLFVYADGGTDLERFHFASFEEARSVLLQTALGLAVAEEACGFEHRDLHWGNLLLRRTFDHGTPLLPQGDSDSGDSDDDSETAAFLDRPRNSWNSAGRLSGPLKYVLRGVPLEIESAGLDVQIIDFTLSRLETEEGFVAFCDLAADPELFEGPAGDAQADTYRRMRDAIGQGAGAGMGGGGGAGVGDAADVAGAERSWADFEPSTNALWMHYLACVVCDEKTFPCSKEQRRMLRAFKKRCLKHQSAADVFWDAFFKDAWRAVG